MDRNKKSGKLKGEKLDEWLAANPFDPEEYKYPTAEMLTELLVNRLNHPD